MPTIRASAGVLLRPLHADDVDDIVRETAVPTTGDFSGGRRRDVLLGQVDSPPVLASDGWQEWAVEAAGDLVGTAQVRAPRRAWPPGVCEIGITLFSAARGRGVGTAAVEALTATLLGDGWARVQAGTAVDNIAMQRVLARCGYRLEGEMGSFAPEPGGGRAAYQLWAVTG